MTNTVLKPCPLCDGKLCLYLRDDTASRTCNGNPCWRGGARCEQCGVGFSVGIFGGGVEAETADRHIIKQLNQRPQTNAKT